MLYVDRAIEHFKMISGIYRAIDHVNISIIFYRQYPRSEDRLRGHKRWLHQRPRDWNMRKEEEHRRVVKQDEL